MNKEENNNIENLKKSTENLILAIRLASDILCEGEVNEGMKLVAQISEGLVYLNSFILSTDKIYGEFDSYEELNDNLVEIISAMENKDYILVADIFNYEIIPILEDIIRILSTIVKS